MGWYECRTCKHNYHSGFLNITYCPKCWGKFSQIAHMLKKTFKITIAPFIVLLIVSLSSPFLFGKIITGTAAALDTTTLYVYSKDAYLESIINGQQQQRFFSITKETPYYSSILSGARLENTEPLGVLPTKTVVELRSVIRRGENVWIPVFFYIEDKPQQAFALFSRNWEQSVTPYDWYARVMEINTMYETVVKKNFQLMQVEQKDEKSYREKYNDYYKVKGMRGNVYFYAPKTDKSRIDNIHSYYLNTNNINMVILQADKEWVRPELVINKTGAGE